MVAAGARPGNVERVSIALPNGQHVSRFRRFRTESPNVHSISERALYSPGGAGLARPRLVGSGQRSTTSWSKATKEVRPQPGLANSFFSPPRCLTAHVGNGSVQLAVFLTSIGGSVIQFHHYRLPAWARGEQRTKPHRPLRSNVGRTPGSAPTPLPHHLKRNGGESGRSKLVSKHNVSSRIC